MQRLIFLDIDGVLNRYKGVDFEPECVAAFNLIAEAARPEIVISSTWRGMIRSGDFSLLGFGKLLRSHGIRGAPVIGYTRESRSGEPRSAEIGDWLRYNRSPDGERRVCILDDDPGAFGGRSGVLTASGFGLTVAGASVAIDILTSESGTEVEEVSK